MAEKLTVLIIGGGAREHAIAAAYEKSDQIEKIVVAPGNAFIKYSLKKQVVCDKDCILNDSTSILEIARKYNPVLVDVAQDDALSIGAVDLLEQFGFIVFGPTKKAARIEWDKKWSREFMQRHRIPHPSFRYFDSQEEGKRYAEQIYSENANRVVFVKASGLCLGKGALKATNLDGAITNIERMKNFGEAGKVFLIEEGLSGEEFSYYAISDGRHYKVFKSAQDHKTVFDFDQGAQTGGMGVVSPALVTANLETQIENELIAKAINGMSAEGQEYKGILYLGGIVVDGKPINIEYNARWGDPECQAVLSSIQTDYVDLALASIYGFVQKIDIKQDDKTRVCVVGASRGYPGDYSSVKGKRIFGLEDLFELERISVYGAGISVVDGNFYAQGGRLFSVVAEGRNVKEAQERAYDTIARVSIEGDNLHYRTDIGRRDMDRFLSNHS